MTTAQDLVGPAMQIIINAGDGRAATYRAIEAIERGDFAGAADQIAKADDSMRAAHLVHTDIIQSDASDEGESPYSILFAHAQDTLMTAYSEFRLIKKLTPVLERFEGRLAALEGAR